MTIIISDEGPSRGPKDARRHRNLWKDLFKKSLGEIILKEDIITGDNKGKKFTFRVKVLDNPDFRYGRRDVKDGDSGHGGIGQGEGDTDDVIARRGAKGKGGGNEGEEGNGRGSGILTEADWDELLDLFAEEVGLPNLSDKKKAIEFMEEYKISGTSRSGPRSLLRRDKTYAEGLKRFFGYLAELGSATGRSELDCFSALKDAERNALHVALELLKDPNFAAAYTEVEPFPIYESDDVRFYAQNLERKPITQAVVIFTLDVSASMDDDNKRFLMKSVAFWTSQIIKREYKSVIIRFIIHPGKNAPAEVVSEYVAFHTKTDGGSTEIFQAMEKARELFIHEYDLRKYDGYVFAFSDGDDFYPQKTATGMRKLIEQEVSMIGYAEVHVGHFDKSEKLLHALTAEFSLNRASTKEIEVMAGPPKYPLVCIVLENKSDVRPAVVEFLKRDRWRK